MGSPRALLVASILSLVPAVAIGQPTKASDAQKAQAGDLVKKAIARSQQGDHGVAIELYQQAYVIVPNSLLLSNIATEYQQSGNLVQALKYFCEYLDKDPTGTNATYATAQAKVIAIQLKEPADDKNVCKPKSAAVTTTTTGGGTTGTGTTGDTGAKTGTGSGVAGGGTDTTTGGGSTTGGSLTGGGVTGTSGLENPGHDTGTGAGGGKGLEYAGIGVGAAGVIAFGVGCYFGLQAKSDSDKITNHPMNQPWPADIASIEADGQSAQNKQIVFMVGGGIAIAGGVVMAILGRPHGSSAEHVTVAPVATANGGGVTVFGRF